MEGKQDLKSLYALYPRTMIVILNKAARWCTAIAFAVVGSGTSSIVAVTGQCCMLDLLHCYVAHLNTREMKKLSRILSKGCFNSGLAVTVVMFRSARCSLFHFSWTHWTPERIEPELHPSTKNINNSVHSLLIIKHTPNGDTAVIERKVPMFVQ